MRTTKPISLTLIVMILASAADLRAQSFRRGGTEFNAARPVSVPAGKAYSIVVTEFFHHGEIAPDRRNVVVSARNLELVPMRVLQLGPGDFCRLAFQTVRGQTSYEVFYGGQPPKEEPPPWTSRDGLLLETRHYKHCDLGSLDSVRKAFDSAKPFGSDYVDGVLHSRNPFCLKPLPFLSHYSGHLQIDSAGTYGFLTSSQDCSFLLIGGKEVVSAPGVHGPLRRATRGTRQDVRLSPGLHEFEYYHAATGPRAVMAAAWEVNPPDVKPKPAAIPSEVFRTGAIARAEAGAVTTRTTRLVPDFRVRIAGDVPLPDNSIPLIGVSFTNNSPKALTMQGKIQWDFGDGQTSDRPNVDHVYLRPDVYTVKLSAKRGTKTVDMVNRVQIDRPPLTAKDKDKLHKLDDYLAILETYNPRTLDAASLRQLVLAYEAKALAVEAQAEEEKQYIAKAVAAGKVAFLEESAAQGSEELHKLAKLIGPMARDRLGDSQLAAQIWYAAARKINVGELKAECEVEAADVAVNDLPVGDVLNADLAKKLLDAATEDLGAKKMGPLAGKLQRVWGDYYAATGDGKAARKAYNQAEQILGSARTYIQRTAWRGAHSRSAEEFIKQGQLDRAAAQIRQWQNEFPTEKIDGYLTLIYARYWAARGKYAQAIAQAEQLQAVGADSPYVDQLLLLAADCEEKRGEVDRALATLHSLVTDYPGSPLVPDAKKTIARLEADGSETPNKPNTGTR